VEALMAIGAIVPYGPIKAVCLLAAAAAVNGVPSGASAGLAIADLYERFGLVLPPTDAALVLFSTAGSGTMSCTARLWGYHPIGNGVWVPLGTGTGADKGKINVGSAIDESGTDVLRHSEAISLVALTGSRLYLELTQISAGVTVEAWLVVRSER
jgi:hypothetical protein